MLNVTQDMIEESVVNYVLQNHRKPRFVLMDNTTYERFSRMFEAKERIMLAEPKKDPEARKPGVTVMWTTEARVNILPVHSNEEIFEVVG